MRPSQNNQGLCAAPAIGIFVLLVHPRALLDWKLYAAGIVAAVLGVSIHLFLPIRAGLAPVINEAAYALMEGVAEAEAIDTIAKLGFAHPMGPLALADLIGLDTCVAIMDVLAEGLGDAKYAPSPLLREKVAAGHLGRKSGRGFYEY